MASDIARPPPRRGAPRQVAFKLNEVTNSMNREHVNFKGLM
jgi:hypothetical protein